MSLPELSIKRHVLAYMMNAVLVVFGIVGFARLGVDRFPNIDFPIISIVTRQMGANPEVVDTSITSVIENEVNSVPGIDFVQSRSSPGVSLVTITFKLNKDIDVAFNEVQTKVNQVLNRLPEDADPPVVAKVQTSASPVLWLALQGDRTLQQLNVYAHNVVKKRLENINGVGEVRLGGQRRRTIRLIVDPSRLAACGLTAQDVLGALRNEHFQLPGGFLANQDKERLLKLDLEYHDPQKMNQMPIGYSDGAVIRFQDVGTVEDALEDFRQLARHNGEPTVGLGIVKVAGANTVAIINEVKKRVREEIIPQLPPAMTLSVASDTSVFILEMVAALKEHLLLGTFLAALVVWFFLRNLRATLMIAVAIPVSLMGAIAAMYFFEYTFDSITLLALLLLIGIVVDDAIVVLENVHRHREHIDPDPLSAAINGTRQVMFAVLASTLSLVAIFVPVIFLGGIVGRFFQSFSVVVVIGVMVSWFVSLTLTPMMCSRYLVVKKTHMKSYIVLEQLFKQMESAYHNLLGVALKHRWKVIFLTVLAVLSSALFFIKLGKEFVPEGDEGRFLVRFKAPLGSTLSYTDSRLRMIEQVISSNQYVKSYFSAIGLGSVGQVNEGIVLANLVDRHERPIHQKPLVAAVRRQLMEIPGVEAYAGEVPIIGGQRGEPLQFVLQGLSLDDVAAYSKEIRRRLLAEPGMGNIELDLQLDLPQLVLDVDRPRAAELGLSPRDIAMAANVLVGGFNAARFNDEPGDGERYDLRIKASEGKFNNPADLSGIFLRTRAGQMVRLDTVARFKEELGPAVISRHGLQYAAFFFGAPSIPLGQALQKIKTITSEVLPLGYSVSYIGQAKEYGAAAGYLAFAFVLAVVMLYMVLASQFNSFLQPLFVMVAQPLAMIGGLASLLFLGYTLNIFSMIGLILLVGMVAKNSILLVDMTNQTRQTGKKVDEALAEACPIRLRPVLMTSLTVILAMLPAALGLGPGADTNGPLAAAIIGGMITSTLLTLVVVPTVYSLVEGALEKRMRRINNLRQ